jgi:hypothetical protein
MKVAKLFAACAGVFLALQILSLAQDRQQPSRGDGGATRSSGSYTGAVGGSTSPGVTNSSGSVGSSREATVSGGGRSGGTQSVYAPSLQGTSFPSLFSYFQWQDFYYYLQTQYSLNDRYFGRFYRNSEPLFTPLLLKLAMREPVRLSNQLTVAVDELQSLLDQLQAGRPVDKAEIANKTEQVRNLAKKIRQDRSVAYFDQRKDTDILKGIDLNREGIDAIARLREIVTDLHTQLVSTYSQSTTSTISVGALSQPSFESLSKAIEKLTKVISNSARQL